MKTRTTRKRAQYGLCVKNRGVEASLELRKVYRLLDHPSAGARGLVRVVDESGNAYLDPSTFFLPIEIPAKATRRFAPAA